MRGAALLAMVALCTVSVASARPDCNACFMKNTGHDKVSNSTVRNGQERIKNEATASLLHRERVLRSKRTAWGAGAARDSLQEVHSRLRDVLMAQNAERMRERAEAADADEVDQWWEDSPADVGGAPEDRRQGSDWGDFRQQDIPSYFQQQMGFGRPLQVAA